jgi:molybdopterin-guanine dinucleotide biosynthesis protein A
MGADKLALEVDGEALPDRSLRRLGEVAEPLIICAGTRAVERPGCRVALDLLPDRGPLGGLCAALGASPHPLCAVVAVDMPELSPPLLLELAQRWHGEDAVVPVAAGRLQPLHAVYARTALAPAERRLRGADLSLMGLLSHLRVQLVDAERLEAHRAAPGWWLSLDTPAELSRWRAEHRSRVGR